MLKTERNEIKERFQSYGIISLNNAEVISLLTRTDTATARDILNKSGGITNLAKMTLEELKNIMTPTSAQVIRASLDLAHRINKTQTQERFCVMSPDTAYEYIEPILRYEQVEKFLAIFMNTKNRIIAHEIISIGSLNATVVHPRELFNRAIAHRASSLIVAHNHPSGDPTPSREDIEITKRLKDAGEIIGIDVLDHIVVGDCSYTSLKEHNLF
jgi:DNA repair protein RadC